MERLIGFALALAFVVVNTAQTQAQQCNVGRPAQAVNQQLIDAQNAQRQATLDAQRAQLTAIQSQRSQIASQPQAASRLTLDNQFQNTAVQFAGYEQQDANNRLQVQEVCNNCPPRQRLAIVAPAPVMTIMPQAPVVVQAPVYSAPAPVVVAPPQQTVVPGRTYQVPGPPVTVREPDQVITQPAQTFQAPAYGQQVFAAPSYGVQNFGGVYGGGFASVGVQGFGVAPVGFYGVGAPVVGVAGLGGRMGWLESIRFNQYTRHAARNGHLAGVGLTQAVALY